MSGEEVPKTLSFDGDGQDAPVSLSEHISQCHRTIMDDSKPLKERLELAQALKKPSADTDSYISISGPCQGHLPAFDTKTFRKAYTFLFWVRPRLCDVGTSMSSGEAEDSGLPPANYVYRLSTQSRDDEAVGVCVTCTPWKLIDNETAVESMLTAYSLPHIKPSAVQYSSRATYSSFLQTPLRLRVNEWSLVGMTHTFPYLKRPMWTLAVNGAVQDQGPLDYPVTDQVLEYNLFLQNVVQQPLQQLVVQEDNSNNGDDTKTASQLNEKPEIRQVPWQLDWAALSIYPQAIGPTLQALACQAGVNTCTSSSGGRVLPYLPAIANWSKGSALEGPKVGVPLVVHSAALDLQQAAGSLILAVGANNTRVLGNSEVGQRIVCTHVHFPGDTSETPRVGLVQPHNVIRIPDEEKPSFYMVGKAQVYSSLGNFIMSLENLDSRTLATCSKSLSMVLQEQGALVTAVLPFFLSLKPPSFDRERNARSLLQLHSLLTDSAAFGSALISNLATIIRHGGSRVHEEVLQQGTLHVLASSLRLVLCRAYQLGFFERPMTSSEWLSHAEGRSGVNEAKKLECPPFIPRAIIDACLELVEACCGPTGLMDDLEPHLQIQRTCDLALTAVFGFCLDPDLWKEDSTLVKAVSDRYGGDCWTGGYLMRSQMSVQYLLDTIRAEPAAGLLQSMLISSLSNRRSIVQGEHDICACVNALCESRLGSAAAHVVLQGLVNVLVWCEILPDLAADDYDANGDARKESGSGTADQKMQVASRLGRNLLVARFHDVVGPMILSRTAFSGELKNTLDWQNHWQMTLLLFTWVSSIAGAEGLSAAESTGSLLLASGLAGSVHDALANAEKTLVSAMYLPPPAMALMIGSNLRDEWSYTDLLADRLQIMMPLLPGMVVSCLPNPNECDLERTPISIENLRSLCYVLASVSGAFHSVYGGTIHSTEGTRRQAKNWRDGSSGSIKAARAYVPYFLTVVMLLETQIAARNDKPLEDITVLRPQTSNEAMRRTDLESWVDVTSESVVSELEVKLNADGNDSQDALVATLTSCQNSGMNTASGLIAQAMSLGGAGTSLSIWTAVLRSFEESLEFYAGRHDEPSNTNEVSEERGLRENMVRNVLCRVGAEVFCKTLKRDYQWEMWTYETSSAVSRLCTVIEEKNILVSRQADGNISADQVLLICAMLDALEYGRDATGWCQLALPAMSPTDASGDLTEASKLLLPVLQPCLRLVLSSLSTIDPSLIVRVPSNSTNDDKEQHPPSTTEYTQEKLFNRVLSELDLTLTAAIVGLSFSSARDTALGAMAVLRKTMASDRFKNDQECMSLCSALLCKLTEELRERYKGEKRLREASMYDAYEGDESGSNHKVAEKSQAVERLILGGELFGNETSGKLKMPETSEQITFDDGADNKGKLSDDLVVFNEPSGGQQRIAKLGYVEYEGLSSALSECHDALEVAEVGTDKAKIAIDTLQKYLDAWDIAAALELEESELVGLFDSVFDGTLTEDPEKSGPGSKSDAASDAMSTFFECAAAEKSRLKEITNRYIPSQRNSRASYTERFCWARFSETFIHDAASLWERGFCDGNRDARSRLATFPVSPQFPRYIPKYLDHGNTDNTEEKLPDSSGSDSDRRKSSVVEIDELTKNLLEKGNLEIVDITKKEEVEDIPEEEFEKSRSIDDADDFFEELPMQEATEVLTEGNEEPMGPSDKVADGGLAEADQPERSSEDQMDEEPPLKASQYNITSSAFATPPDNASSSLGLIHSAAASRIEMHMENCLHVKAEGSRHCTLLLTRTHLILEYNGDDDGFYEGELLAAREEAQRQRMIDEAGGVSAEHSVDDAFQLRAEKRQREIASLRSRSIRWNLSEASHIYLRRYRLRDSSLEIFFIPTGGSAFGGYGAFSPAASIFIDFGSGYEGNERRDNAAFAIMKRTPPQSVKHWPDRSEQFIHDQLSRLTMGWVEGRVSNFDYLLHLNMLAGRSYNDLCQYPVMPWVLADYTSEEVPDLTDRNSFRDLSKPVGALNPERLEDFRDRFESFSDPSIPKFMYGSHYSTSAGVVLHFLVRMHPFAGLHRQLQSGHFDVADRLFSSIPRTWAMCTGSSAAEVKEITPEWYCNPSFLRNSNNFKLGTSQDGEVIGDVVLPPWAKGDPDKFVEIMRAALESEICSDMLPDWIDLIFGRKQQGSEAVKANNVFFYLTYYGSVDVASIEDEGLRQATELQIAHFGQCPRQLLRRSHVRRLPPSFHKLSFFQLLSTYAQKGLNRESHVGGDDDSAERSSLTGEMGFLPFFSAPISHWVHLDAPPPGPHADLISLRLAGSDRCLAVDAKGIFHTFRWAWRPGNETEATPNFDPGCFIAQRELPRFKTVPSLIYTPPTGERPIVAISKTLFANRSVLLVLSAADAEGGLGMQLVDPVKGNIRGEVTVPAVHSGQITCIATDPIGTAAGHGGVGGELSILGSVDGSASIWRFMSSHYLPMRPRIRLSGHDGRKINGVALCATLHLAATVSSQRCCIHAIGNGSLIRSFEPPDDNLFGETYITTTRFAETPALAVSIQGFIVTVCETLSRSATGSERTVRSLQLFSMDGRSIGCKPLEDWRGVPNKLICSPDGTAVMVCCGRGVTLHRLSACRPLEFLDEWQVTEEDDVDNMTHALDMDLGPSLNRPVVAAAACSSGVLRLHALPGISAWSHRHNKGGLSHSVGSALAKPAKRLNKVVREGFGIGKHLAGVGRDIGKEVQSDVKERGVGGFLGGVFGKKKS